MTLPPVERFAADVLGLDLRTRRGWVAVHRAIDGRPLDEHERRLFAAHTGRAYIARSRPHRQALILAGRQSGKTDNAALRLVYSGAECTARQERDIACVGLAQDHRAAIRVLFGRVQQFIDAAPLLRPLVTNRTADTITLQGGVQILVLPCRPAAIRGLRCRVVVLDEICHFRSTEGNPLDREAWRAALPTLLTTDGLLLAISSPYAASGLAYELHRSHFGRFSDLLVWQSPGTILNPTLDEQFLGHLREIDPTAARAEVDAEFLRDVAALFDDGAVLDEAVDAGVRERPAMSGVEYISHDDGASGGGKDRWAKVIAHREGDRVIVDLLRTWQPPFSPASVIGESAALNRQYGVRVQTLDRFATNVLRDGFQGHGVVCKLHEHDTSTNYVNFAGLVNSRRVRLLDRPELLRELRGLERRHVAGGRDRVIHRVGAHDDRAAAVAAACALVAAAARSGRIQVIKLQGL